MGFTPGSPVVATRDFFKRMQKMGTGKCFGVMEIFTEAGGKMESSMERGNFLWLIKDS